MTKALFSSPKLQFVCFLFLNGLFSREAQAYNHANCSSSTWTEVPVRLGPEDLDREWGDGNGLKYTNGKDFSWRVWSNPNVNLVGMGVSSWDIESGFDSMIVTDRLGPTVLTGLIANGWYSSHFTLPAISSQRSGSYLNFQWYTDSSVTKNSPLIDKVRVKCSGDWPTTNSKGLVMPNRRQEGILIDTGDVMYFTSNQPAFHRMIITLDHLSTQVAADFDLYASPIQSMPEFSNAQWSSRTTSGSESIVIEPTLFARNIYWGVHSYSGKGHFAYHVNLQPTGTPSDMTVCTPAGFNISNADKPFFTDFLKESSLRFHSATQGNIWLRSWNVVQSLSCTSNCNLCIELTDNPPDEKGKVICDMYGPGQGCTRVIGVRPCVWRNSQGYGLGTIGRAVAHEYGHTCFQLGDEYNYTSPPSKSWCGHSLMSLEVNVKNQFCTARDHCLNPVRFDAACAIQNSAWDSLLSSPYMVYPPPPNTTPYSTHFVRNQSLRDNIVVTYPN